MTDTILVDESGGVFTITLNRPKVHNAMSREMVDELVSALDAVEGNPAIRVLVLRGAGGHFCAGGDIKDMAQARMAQSEGDADPVRELSATFGRLALAYSRAATPVVAVIEGAVMGGGFGLACTADVAIASTTARFRLPETSLGLIPAQIAPFLIERLGYSEAKRLAILGATLNAQQALDVRLVHEVVEPEELDGALEATLKKIMRGAPAATESTKKLFHHLHEQISEQTIHHAATVFAEAARGDEAAEGVQAFLSKRDPSWATDR